MFMMVRTTNQGLADSGSGFGRNAMSKAGLTRLTTDESPIVVAIGMLKTFVG